MPSCRAQKMSSGSEAAGKETDHILIVFRLLQSDQRFSIDPRSMSLPDNIFAPYRYVK